MERVVTIEPGQKERHYWRELWNYRELFVALAWRDLSVRYKQTVIGVIWAVIRPLLAVTIFTIIFGRIAKLPSAGTTPYAVLVFVGMLPWTFFSTALSDASNSLISNANLISKIYFPRMIVPRVSFFRKPSNQGLPCWRRKCGKGRWRRERPSIASVLPRLFQTFCFYPRAIPRSSPLTDMIR